MVGVAYTLFARAMYRQQLAALQRELAAEHAAHALQQAHFRQPMPPPPPPAAPDMPRRANARTCLQRSVSFRSCFRTDGGCRLGWQGCCGLVSPGRV